MTQLVKKDSSWRTLRRKAVVGASSFALVAGMGVALAPSAAAADPVAPTVSIDAPDQISNNWGITPSAASGNVKVTVKSNDANAATTLSYRVTVTPPAGVQCVDIDIDGVDGHFAPATLASSGACVATLTGAAPTVAALATQVSNFTITVTTLAAPTVFDTAPTGEIGLKVEVGFGGTGVVTATDAAQLVTPGNATFEDTVTAPKFGSTYNAALVKTPAYPAATTFTANSKKADGTAGPTHTRIGRVTFGTAITDYVSLSDADFATYNATPGANNSMTGFYLNATTGKIVFGTLTVTGADSAATPAVAAATFTAKPVNARNASTVEWTVTAAAANGGAAVTSKAFRLDVGFSDVSSTNVFADAINTLAGAGIIKGYADGTFGVAQNITRGEFAQAAFGVLKKTGSPTAITCGTGAGETASAFTDVANTNVFCDSIMGLVKAGVVKGTSATTFSPNAKITRDQIAAFIFRMNGASLGTQVGDAPQTTTQFTDVPKSNFASGDIAWGASNGIINGRSATIFDPAGNTLRQEAAGLLYRFGNSWSVSW